jgi:hypothetical protein
MPPKSSSTLFSHRSVKESDAESFAWTNEKASAKAKRAAEARQASPRRRGIDPTTCERDYSKAELEFMKAMEAYKHQSGRMFPTWCEVLEVIKTIGYEKPAERKENETGRA